uniref:Uncharacterized protein n=1 Tax=Globodera rostochiensis TaxID=31243 RepID=A0A914I074_GLORO
MASRISVPQTPSNPFETVVSTYQHFVQLCDDGTRRNVALTTSAIAMFIIYGLGIVSQAVVLPANWRLSEQRSAFMLLLHINIFDLVWLFEYVWLSLEFLIGARLKDTYSLHSYLFRFVNFCIDTLYIELAFNRCIAFLFPRLYNVICSQKNMKVCVACTYCLSIAYTIYTNWFAERRPFHCLIQLGYFEPMTSIPKNITSLLKPASNPVQIAIVLPVGSQTNQAERTIFVNLMQERTRLFSMCLLSQVPYYMSHALYQSSRFFQLDENAVQVLAIFWQLLGTIFHVQQPILMLLLSGDLRSSVRIIVDGFNAAKFENPETTAINVTNRFSGVSSPAPLAPPALAPPALAPPALAPPAPAPPPSFSPIIIYAILLITICILLLAIIIFCHQFPQFRLCHNRQNALPKANPTSAALAPVPSAALAPVPSAALAPVPSAALAPVPSAALAPVPSAALAPVPSAALAPVPSAALAPVPSAALAPVPSAALAPVPSAALAPVPSAALAPVPSAALAPVPSATLISASSSTITTYECKWKRTIMERCFPHEHRTIIDHAWRTQTSFY